MSASTRISPIGRAGWSTAIDTWLRRAAVSATLVLPIVMPYGRSAADVLLSVVVILFLATPRTWSDRNWLHAPHTRLMLLLWVWMLACSVLVEQVRPVGQALLALRLFLFATALENWVLSDGRTRRRLWYVVLAAALWIVLECWQQYLLGVNVLGYTRYGDGALTGPYTGVIAGPTFLLVLFPAFLPLCFALLQRHRVLDWIGALGILAFAMITMLLIGQRMPSVLTLLGLCVTALLFRQFRVPVVLTMIAGAILLALLPVVSPPTFAKLVVRFSDQMHAFWSTQYGMIFGRAMTMIQAHPWVGLGWDGFRNNCMNPRYLHGVSWLPIPNPASSDGCNIHPHNYWLQIATTAGLPGVALFGALAFLWLRRVAGTASYQTNARRAGLLIVLVIMLWPIDSTTSLFTLPNAGWFFLLIGWGLAEARATDRPALPNPVPPTHVAIG